MKDYMQELNDAYNEIEKMKAQFDALKEIDPKDDDRMYKYLLHKLRDLREELVERWGEIINLVDSMKSVFEIEKELVYNVDLR